MRSDPSSAVDVAALFRGQPTAYLVMDPDLVIIEVNDAYCKLLDRTRSDLLGVYVFDAFPPASDAIDDQGRNTLQLSFERARDTGRADALPLYSYGVADPTTGQVAQRHWSLIAAPLQDEAGHVIAVLQRVEDVTDYIHATRGREADGHSAALGHPGQQGPGSQRLAQVEAELHARIQDLHAARRAEQAAAAAADALAHLALSLNGAETVHDLVDLLTDQGLAVLGSRSGAIAVFTDSDRRWLDLSITDGFGARAQREYAHLPADGPLPASHAARTGTQVLLPDAAASLRWAPQMQEVMATTGSCAFVSLPLQVTGRVLGSLTTGWETDQPFGGEQMHLLEAFAAQCAQALDRILVRHREQAAADRAAAAWGTLQRSLLTDPPEQDHMQIVVRYRPAADAAQVGGDWYDAFLQREGATVLVIGDVVGHDSTAAAAMGQVRGTLRAIGVHTGLGPAELLSATDHAMNDLLLPTTASALVAQVEQTPQQRELGVTQVRWSSAGHLPAMVLTADGTVTALVGSESDLLLGVMPATTRHEWTVTLDRDATLFLYTDGLVERRGESLEVGLERLKKTIQRRRSVSDHADTTGPVPSSTAGTQQGDLGSSDLDRLVDQVLDELVAERAGDDVAVIAVRLHPRDHPRPAPADSDHVNNVVPPDPR